MRGLAARCRTGIQHAHPVVNIQQTRGVLRTGILHRNQPIKESRQPVHRHRLVQLQRIRLDQPCRQILPVQQRQIFRCRIAALIDAQSHRRMLIAGFKYRRAALAILCLQFIYPPLRITIFPFVACCAACSSNASWLRKKLRRIALTRPLTFAFNICAERTA